jgi:hypothetical protein
MIVSALMNLAAPAAFQGLIDHDVQRPAGLAKGRDDELEQLLTRLQRRPASPIQHLVKDAKIRVLLMASLPQGSGHRSTDLILMLAELLCMGINC